MNKRIREKLRKNTAKAAIAELVDHEDVHIPVTNDDVLPQKVAAPIPAEYLTAEEKDTQVLLGSATQLVLKEHTLRHKDFIPHIGDPNDHIEQPNPHITTLYWQSDDEKFRSDATVLHTFDANGQEKNYLTGIKLYPADKDQETLRAFHQLKLRLSKAKIHTDYQSKPQHAVHIRYQDIHTLMEDRQLLPPLMRRSMREQFEDYGVNAQLGERYR